jgi:hypothetical protein
MRKFKIEVGIGEILKEIGDNVNELLGGTARKFILDEKNPTADT